MMPPGYPSPPFNSGKTEPSSSPVNIRGHHLYLKSLHAGLPPTEDAPCWRLPNGPPCTRRDHQDHCRRHVSTVLSIYDGLRGPCISGTGLGLNLQRVTQMGLGFGHH